MSGWTLFVLSMFVGQIVRLPLRWRLQWRYPTQTRNAPPNNGRIRIIVFIGTPICAGIIAFGIG